MNRTILEEAGEIANPNPVALRLMTYALNALSSRALVWVSFIGGAALWVLAMLEPSWIKIAVALGYCGSIFAPILIRDSKGS